MASFNPPATSATYPDPARKRFPGAKDRGKSGCAFAGEAILLVHNKLHNTCTNLICFLVPQKRFVVDGRRECEARGIGLNTYTSRYIITAVS